MRQRGCLSTTSPVGRLKQTLYTQHALILLKRTHAYNVDTTARRTTPVQGQLEGIWSYHMNSKNANIFEYSIPKARLNKIQSAITQKNCETEQTGAFRFKFIKIFRQSSHIHYIFSWLSGKGRLKISKVIEKQLQITCLTCNCFLEECFITLHYIAIILQSDKILTFKTKGNKMKFPWKYYFTKTSCGLF